jgi:hypothetical protein
MVGTCRAKPPITALGLFDDTNFLYLWGFTLFDDELGHAVPLLDFKHTFSVIEEKNFNLPRIIWVYNSRADVNTVFDGETRARGDATIGAYWQNNCDPRTDKCARAANDTNILIRI